MILRNTSLTENYYYIKIIVIFKHKNLLLPAHWQLTITISTISYQVHASPHAFALRLVHMDCLWRAMKAVCKVSYSQ